MVIIIGAGSCSGKTLMAQNLLKKYQIPFYSIDHIKMGIFRANANCGFYPCDSNEKIARELWPIIKGIVMTAIENEQDLIIEGCYVFPDSIDELPKEYKKEILPVFFGFSESYIHDQFEIGMLAYRSIAELRTCEEERPPQVFIDDNILFKDKCAEHGMDYFQITHDYESEIKVIYDYIDSKIKLKKEHL